MKKNLFQSFLILITILISSNVVRSEEELRMSASEKAWSVFYPNDKKNWGKLKTRKVAKREMIAEVVSPRNHIQLY